MTVFELMAKLVLDKSEYSEGLEESEEEARSFGERLKSGLGTAAKVGGAAIGAVAAGAGALAATLMSGVSDLATYGDGVDKASQKLGISAEAYQEWDAVLQHSGTSMSAMTGTFRVLANVVQGASDKQAAALDKLGVSFEDIADLKTEDLFALIVERLQGMEEGTERSWIATQLLGRGAMEMGALLNTSAEDTQAMRDRVHELGGVLSDDGVKSAATFNDELQDMQTAIQGIGREIMVNFLPAFSDAMHLIQDLVTSESFSGFAESAAEVFQHIIDIMENTLLPALERMWPSISSILDSVLGLFDALLPVLEPIIDGIVWILENVLVPAIEGVVGVISGLIGMLTGDVAPNVQTLADATDSLAGAQERLADALNNVSTAEEKLESAQDRLADLERQTGRDAEDIAQRIEDGRLKYEDLDSTLQDLYDAYMDVQRATEELKSAQEAAKTATDEYKDSIWEAERALAAESGTLEEFAAKVIIANQEGRLDLQDTQRLVEEAMAGMGLAAEVTFLEKIPAAIRDGLNPTRYETFASAMKKLFDWAWNIETLPFQKWYELVKSTFIDPLGIDFGTLKTTIIQAFEDAWNGIKAVFEGAAGWFMDNVITPIANAFNSILSLIDQAAQDTFNADEKAAALTSKKKTSTSGGNKTFPHLAGGGILRRGEIGILEGNGAEAVVPLDQNEKWISAVARDMSKAIGGGTTNSISINVYAAEGQDEKRIADEVDRRLWERLNGRDMVYA